MLAPSRRLGEQTPYAIWRSENPLRHFRSTQAPPVAIWEAASSMGVSNHTVVVWENGASIPRPEMMSRIAAFTRDPEIADKWALWMARRGMYNREEAVTA